MSTPGKARGGVALVPDSADSTGGDAPMTGSAKEAVRTRVLVAGVIIVSAALSIAAIVFVGWLVGELPWLLHLSSPDEIPVRWSS